MLFNSFAFLLFFPIVWFCYLVAPRSLQNLVILIASYVFYGWWDFRFLGLLILSTAIDYGLGRLLGVTSAPMRRRAFIVLSVIVNLGILGFFKYFNFFVESFVELAALGGISLRPTTLQVVLPVGISFYTFQSLSYTIDVYRRHLPAENSFLRYAAYVAFFPQLVAGPIERATHLLPQFHLHRFLNYEALLDGGRLFLFGMFKKIVIADNLDQIVAGGYGDYASGPYALLATYAFAFQIYCDFSGYSDMARGLGRCFGVELMVNFRCPYLATSIRDFWLRWHISLSTWFRDYVYVPLGGNRCSAVRQAWNIFFTFALSGLWHGANARFLIWGILHGLFYIPEVLARRRDGQERPRSPLSVVFRWFVTFHFVLLAWVFFRANDSSHALTILASIATGAEGRMPPAIYVAEVVLLCGGLLLLEFIRRHAPHVLSVDGVRPRWRLAITLGLFALLLILGNFDAVPFIYFQF